MKYHLFIASVRELPHATLYRRSMSGADDANAASQASWACELFDEECDLSNKCNPEPKRYEYTGTPYNLNK